jgi:hypothetical protein
MTVVNKLLGLSGRVMLFPSATILLGGIAAGWPQGERVAADKNAARWCFAWTPKLPDGTQDRAALIKAAKWPSASVISISFLDGDTVVQQKVMDHAVKWTREFGGPANLTFDFRKQGPTSIRISFKYAGAWSLIGTGCKDPSIPQDQPTMNYGWLRPDTPDDEYRRVVLHEFGHAIGLIHEHQNPAGGIEWNQVQVIADLSGAPNNWSVPVISRNMFESYAAKDTNHTDKIDPASIMMYPIPENWTLNHFSAGLNSQLTDTDKEFVKSQYP